MEPGRAGWHSSGADHSVMNCWHRSRPTVWEHRKTGFEERTDHEAIPPGTPGSLPFLLSSQGSVFDSALGYSMPPCRAPGRNPHPSPALRRGAALGYDIAPYGLENRAHPVEES